LDCRSARVTWVPVGAPHCGRVRSSKLKGMSGPAWRVNDPWDPRNPTNRVRTRVLVGQLRARLLAWDPIGIGEAPEAQDEYDCLIGPLMHRLSDSASEVEIANHLVTELREHFGLEPDESRERSLAAELKRWWSTGTTSE
jgi:hypothetical protein